ncbi:flavin-binding monooxygenase-like protein [Aspergillus sclerotioniger CBS 115572]|uniref:Flavin-binding monooxygenase-like protein n=1 Tax=Aspergillus sclerotioniger CBS 115572 TaxID=1450535 RepID=A0A317X4A8_9EURO|nr:flavin-binding monooxygenase-like protein [Aspergillus sclerotioniger CBS 115572]PWY93439.1 flavin-binding monooxygenase-like protein [Aspergillus sclerotioniger CBS 115572]
MSKVHVEPGSFNVPVGKFPQTSSSTDVNAAQVASQLVEKINTALSKGDVQAICDLFLEDGFWRDHLCLTWDFHTAKGRDNIFSLLKSARLPSKIEIDSSSPFKGPYLGPIDAFGDVTGVLFFITLSDSLSNGRGLVRLAEKDGEWKIFTFFTSMVGFVDHAEAVDHKRPLGAQHGENPDRKNWQDRRTADINAEGKSPTVLVVGAGQSGLTIAARLKMLGIDALVIDEEDRIGDNWRRRYHQLVLHDPVWFDNLPYVPFPPNWPIFTPKDKLAEFFECYAKLMELNVWTKTGIKKSSWDGQEKVWTIDLQRRKEDGTVETRTIQPRYIVQATGHSGKKNLPNFKGIDSFQGDRICHSSEFPGANPESKGKKAVVVGACNSGHDIAQDYYEKGYDVTIVQRSSTCVISSQAIVDIGLKGLYEEDGPPNEDADLYLWSIPSELFKAQQIKITRLQNQRDQATLEGLERAGFQVDRGPNEAGLLVKYLQRGGGYYIDVGASQLIVDGKVKVKQGQEITEILPHGLRFADGTELEADEIILATGYQNMSTQARIIFGDEGAEVNDVWGFDERGEMRMWRRTGHPGLWLMGGNLALCRYYSRLLALQIKALELGVTSYDG